MPSTGTSSPNTAGSHFGAPASDTLLGPPDRIKPAGRFARIESSGVLNGTISEYTDNSRRRRAMSCVYCEPKSRMRIVWCDTAKGLGGSSYYRSTYCGSLRPIAVDCAGDRVHLERCFGATTKALARAIPHAPSSG